MVRRASLWHNQMPHSPGRKPTNWWIIISQKFSCRSKSVKFHIRMPNLGIWPWLQMIWFWRLVGLECRCSIGLGETETLLLKGACKVSCIPGPKGKSSDFIGAQTCQLVLEGLMGRGGAAVVQCGDKDTGGGATEGYSSVNFPGSHHFGIKTWPHTTTYRFHCWGVSGQTTNMTETQLHPSADRLLKDFLSSWHFYPCCLMQPCPPEDKDSALFTNG